MRDLLVYCPDTSALVEALQRQYPERLYVDDAENPRFLVDKTPTRRNGSETLALVRCRDGEPGELDTEAALRTLESSGVVQILGTYEEVWADPSLKTIYDRVYPRTPVTIIDAETGVEYEHIPPERIGEFA